MRISKKKFKKMQRKIAHYKKLKSGLKNAGALYTKERKPYSATENYTRWFW